LLSANQPVCPVCRLLKYAEGSAFKCFILATPLILCLLRNMSVLVPDNLRDQDCKKGQVTAQPLVSNVQFKYKPWVSEPKMIKLKLAEGNIFTCNLMNDSSNSETYLKWILVYLHVREGKELDEKLTATMEILAKV
jgi:hypothetical protein